MSRELLSQKPKRKRKLLTRKRVIILLLSLPLLIIALPIVALTIASLQPNYAEEVAEPFEKALTVKGATKVCDWGSNGYGVDNSAPWYKAYFRVPGERPQTVSTLTEIANANGFKLTHASPQNRPHAYIADEYLDDIYFDYTSKKSPYKRFDKGTIDLMVRVYEEESELSCNEDDYTDPPEDPSRMVVLLEVSLPDGLGR